MDSPPPSPSLVLQLTSQSAHQHQPSTSCKIDQSQGADIQSSDNASKQLQRQSTIEIPGTKFEQSQVQPNNDYTDYTDALEAEIVCLQSEMTRYNSTIHNLQTENEYLKVRLQGYRECIKILLKHLYKKQEEEKIIDRKEKKKAVEYDELESELKKVGAYIDEDTNEMDNVMAFSDDSDDSDSDNTTNQELESDDEEEDAQMQSVLYMSRFEAFGSSSKMGSELVEIGDIIKSKSVKDCAPSNGKVEKLNVFYENKTLFKEPQKSELAIMHEKLYGPNHNQGLILGGSNNENRSPTSPQTVLPLDPMKSNYRTSTPEILKSNEDEAKLMQRKRKRIACWHTEEEMLCALKEEMLLEAVCALFREDYKLFQSKSSKRTLALSESDFNKLKHVAGFLMERDMNNPNTKTTEELEKYIKGGDHFCAILVGTYSRELFQIYISGMDEHFC